MTVTKDSFDLLPRAGRNQLVAALMVAALAFVIGLGLVARTELHASFEPSVEIGARDHPWIAPQQPVLVEDDRSDDRNRPAPGADADAIFSPVAAVETEYAAPKSAPVAIGGVERTLRSLNPARAPPPAA